MENPISSDKKIFQHNAITSGHYDFSACQMDILFLLLAMLDRNDSESKVYTLHIRDIELLTGRKWDYGQFRQATLNMGGNGGVFEIRIGKDLKQIWIFDSVHYKTGEGCIEFLLSKSIRPYLFNLKDNFTVMELASILKCSSKYAKRIYALCCMWRNMGVVHMEITALKDMLYLKDSCGKEQYSRNSNFQMKVLEPAKTQINKHTDIHFDYEMIKVGRSFKKVKITINLQHIKEPEIDFSESLEYQKRVKHIETYGISEAVAKEIARRHFNEFEQIVSNINEKLKTKKMHLPKDVPAYIVGALKKKGLLK